MANSRVERAGSIETECIDSGSDIPNRRGVAAESTKTGGYVLVTACIVGERKSSNGRISAETVVVAKRYITHSRTVVAGGVGLERIITCGGVLNAGVEVKRSRPSSRIIITSGNEQERTVTKGSVA